MTHPEPYMGLYAERNLAEAVQVCPTHVIVTLRDQRIVHVPIDWFPWLKQATPAQQADFTIVGTSIFWNQLEDGFSMEPVLLGQPDKKAPRP